MYFEEDNVNKFKRGDIIKVKSWLTNISPVPIWHYGVVVGEDEVVHFNLDNELDICIIKTDICKFVNNGTELKCCKISEFYKKYSDDVVATRAETQVGTDFGGYDLIKNNCEHFANWCASGEKFSNQILSDEDDGHSVGEKLADKCSSALYEVEDAFDEFAEKVDGFISWLDDILS